MLFKYIIYYKLDTMLYLYNVQFFFKLYIKYNLVNSYGMFHFDITRILNQQFSIT